jgi:hypothetical protein
VTVLWGPLVVFCFMLTPPAALQSDPLNTFPPPSSLNCVLKLPVVIDLIDHKGVVACRCVTFTQYINLGGLTSLVLLLAVASQLAF